MELMHEQRGAVLVVKVAEKRLDARTSSEFKHQLAELIHAGNQRLVVDLSEVEFIDSSGLGAIVSSLKLLGGEGDLVISGARDTVTSMFKLTRMDKVFQMFSGREQAAGALAA